MSMNLRDAALSYAARGWPVFPVHGIMDDGNGRPVCTCGRGEACGPDAGKHLSPIASRGRKDATRSTEKISRWWPDAPGATPWNIAILTGRRSGLYVVDGRSDAIARIPSDLPQTLASETGGGSTHLFFAYPDGVELFRNTTGRIAEGVKTRGDDGWLIVPPSLHHSGHAYSWQNDAEVAPLPPELLSRLGAPSVPSVRPSTVDASTLLDDVADLPIAAPSDRRSHRDPFAIVSTRIRGDDVEPALRALADRLARIGVERDAVVAAVCDANDRNADPQLDTDIAELLAYDAIAREVDRREILRKTTTASVVDAKTAGGQKKSAELDRLGKDRTPGPYGALKALLLTKLSVVHYDETSHELAVVWHTLTGGVSAQLRLETLAEVELAVLRHLGSCSTFAIRTHPKAKGKQILDVLRDLAANAPAKESDREDSEPVALVRAIRSSQAWLRDETGTGAGAQANYAATIENLVGWNKHACVGNGIDHNGMRLLVVSLDAVANGMLRSNPQFRGRSASELLRLLREAPGYWPGEARSIPIVRQSGTRMRLHAIDVLEFDRVTGYVPPAARDVATGPQTPSAGFSQNRGTRGTDPTSPAPKAYVAPIQAELPCPTGGAGGGTDGTDRAGRRDF